MATLGHHDHDGFRSFSGEKLPGVLTVFRNRGRVRQNLVKFSKPESYVRS